MSHRNAESRRVHLFAATVLLFTAAIGFPNANATIYDLKADWSDSSNPNGVWFYNEGINTMAHQASWAPPVFTTAQPAWARSSGSSPDDHTFLPGWFRLSATPADVIDLQTVDMSVHSTDSVNGVGSGPGDVTWTSPAAGTIDLSGAVWEARDIGRSNHWSLLVDGTVVSAGDISAANSSRSSPFILASGTGGPGALNHIPVVAGEVVKLQFDATSFPGDFVGVNLTVNVVSCTPPPDGLVAWYPGNGNAYDVQGGNDGTLQGDATFAAGKVGQAFSLDGVNDFVEIPDSPSLSITKAITVDAWINPTDVTDAMIASQYDSSIGQDSWAFFVVNGRLKWSVHQDTTLTFRAVQTDAVVVNTGVWTHVAGTFDTATQEMKVYVNGTEVPTTLDGGSQTVTQILDSTAPFRIGTIVNVVGELVEFFAGLIDEVELFNRALSVEEIAAIFNAGSAGKCLPPSQLLNISTRLKVLTDDNVLIGGFIVTGTDPKKVIVRGIGPSLGAFGISDALADPVLELHEADGTIVTNDNWKDTQQTEITATGLQPSDNLESAILATLAPGAYTAILRGNKGGIGVGLVEAYDLEQAAASTLANISTRGFINTGDNVMIGGFILGGGANGEVATIVVRGIGPSLTPFGVVGALQDPILELHNGDGSLLAANDNWKDGPDQQTIMDDGLAPTDDAESALLATLAPGAYTAIVRGVGDTTGVGLVEAYNLLP